MDEGDAPVPGLAGRGDEEEVVRVPRRLVGGSGAGAFLGNEGAQGAAQHHDGEALRLEVHVEDAPGQVAGGGTELLYLVDLDLVPLVEAKFLRLVVEGEILDLQSSSKGQSSSSRRYSTRDSKVS